MLVPCAKFVSKFSGPTSAISIIKPSATEMQTWVKFKTYRGNKIGYLKFPQRGRLIFPQIQLNGRVGWKGQRMHLSEEQVGVEGSEDDEVEEKLNELRRMGIAVNIVRDWEVDWLGNPTQSPVFVTSPLALSSVSSFNLHAKKWGQNVCNLHISCHFVSSNQTEIYQRPGSEELKDKHNTTF